MFSLLVSPYEGYTNGKGTKDPGRTHWPYVKKE
jgi:hypothetical protein